MVENTLHNWAPPFPARLQDSAVHHNQNNRPACIANQQASCARRGRLKASVRQNLSLTKHLQAEGRAVSVASPGLPIGFPFPALACPHFFPYYLPAPASAPLQLLPEITHLTFATVASTFATDAGERLPGHETCSGGTAKQPECSTAPAARASRGASPIASGPRGCRMGPPHPHTLPQGRWLHLPQLCWELPSAHGAVRALLRSQAW